MLYLLDASVLITAHSNYYPVDAVPEFWDWLAHHCQASNVKMPIETFEEVRDGSNDAEQDLLYGWVRNDAIKDALLFGEEVNRDLVRRVIDEGYAPDLRDDEIEQIGRDPFLIAYALASPNDRCVVSNEVSRPRKQRQNRKIPDICRELGVQCCDTFTMTRTLGFATNWRARR